MNKKTFFSGYLKNLTSVAERGDAREESFYPLLKGMLEKVAEATSRPQVHVTTMPRSTEAGNPDFRLWNGTDRVVGYVEAKKPTQERLDDIEDSEQLRRYRGTFPNLILTNFLEFRLYRDGERAETVQLARPFVLTRLHTIPPVEKADELWALFDRFLDFSIPRAFSAETLAVELAKRTRFLRDNVAEQLAKEQARGDGQLFGFYEAFKKFLIGNLMPEDFADLYAQTITYGLFAARLRAGGPFSRRSAFDNIPHTVGVLRDLFRFISLGELPAELAWIVDDISEVLAVADAPGILDRYYREGKGSDPIVHFYETFLAKYDPEERERRGVYYTPEPVVGYIVRSLHHILKTEFGKPDGLASDGVTLLDPAAGTMTFIARAAREAVREFEAKYGSGGREPFIRRHILQNFYAFELMMAPYAVGHLKMSFFLQELGHRLRDDERVPFYLTNTLDMAELEKSPLPGFSSLAEESRLAGKVKKEKPILVVLGNPPYSGHSVNRGEWILEKIGDYKRVDGKPLGEKNPKWLQDDYVKFLRFAQWKIEQAGRGVVGMITNHSYLDNPTFRGMRQSLMQTFDDIFILDLHGNSLKKETAPDGSKDENVFDIRQGVAIAFFIKRGRRHGGSAAVQHAELWGLREKKYAWLETHSLTTISWTKIRPTPPFYLFVPQSEVGFRQYIRFPSITRLFPENHTGIIAGRDSLAIHYTPDHAWNTVRTFASLDPDLARESYKLTSDARDWRVEWAQDDLLEIGLDRNRVVPLLYRPFDIRFTYYTGRNRGFLRWAYPDFFGRHMLAGANVAIIAPRQHKDEFGAYVTAHIGAHKTVAAYDINYYFPLYTYPAPDRRDLFSRHEPSDRKPNLNPKVVTALADAFGKEPTPEATFHYAYAILYSPTYRTKYAEFLKMDFPRIPFTANAELFAKMAVLGARLALLHLLKSTELDPPLARFDGHGDNRIGKGKAQGLRYDPASGRVHVNATQYFAPIPPEVWEYRIGGYQVCEKWLKDRVERRLELEDIRTYCRIVTALARTIEIQQAIDAIYPQIESNPLSLRFEDA